jgi:hypothetical protein
MLQTIADIPTPEGRLRVERVVTDPHDSYEPPIGRVVSVGAYLSNELISCERAEDLLSAVLTAERNDGTVYRVTIGKQNGELSAWPPLS